MPKNINYFKYLVIILVIFGLLGTFLFYANIKYINSEGVNLSNLKMANTITFSPSEKISIKQQLSATQKNLAKIIIPVITDVTQNLSLSLASEEAYINIRQKQITISADQTKQQYIVWEFKPLESNAQNYFLSINGITNKNSSLTFYVVAPDKYDGGELLINNNILNNWRMVVDWQYKNSTPISTILNQLSYSKPWPLNKPWVIMIFIALYLISVPVVLLVIYNSNKNVDD